MSGAVYDADEVWKKVWGKVCDADEDEVWRKASGVDDAFYRDHSYRRNLP